MARQIGGLGSLGLGFETTVGTWTIPTVFLPIRSETLTKAQNKQWRMNIRGLPGRQNPIQGYTRIEGDVVFEVDRQNILYFLYAARMNPAKTGTTPNFTYTFTPASVTEPTTASGANTRKTLSLQLKRADQIFGYSGCSVTQLVFSVDNSILICTATLIGIDEATQSETSETYTAQTVYSAGAVSLAAAAPTASARTDVDTVSITINDNGTAENRIKAPGTGPQFIKWGEREVSISLDFDFDSKADYTAFVAQTIYEMYLKGSNSATADEISIKVNQLALETAPVNLANIGDLVKASSTGHGFEGNTDIYTIVVKSTEVIS